MLQEKLKRFRKEKGFSQEQLAVRLHIVRQTVSKWEQGLSVPDAEMLVRVSEVLEVPVADLLGKTAGEEPPDSTPDNIARELQIKIIGCALNRKSRPLRQKLKGRDFDLYVPDVLMGNRLLQKGHITASPRNCIPWKNLLLFNKREVHAV